MDLDYTEKIESVVDNSRLGKSYLEFVKSRGESKKIKLEDLLITLDDIKIFLDKNKDIISW